MSRIYNNALTPAELKTLERLQQKQRKYTRDEAAFWRQVDERHDEIIAHFSKQNNAAVPTSVSQGADDSDDEIPEVFEEETTSDSSVNTTGSYGSYSPYNRQ